MGRQLGHMETALTLTDAYAPFNVTALLTLRKGFSPQQVGTTLNSLLEHHWVLRQGIHKVKDQYRFEEEEVSTLPLTVVENTALSIWELVEEELNHPFNISQAPLLRCQWVKGEKQIDYILLTFHHAIVDAVSGLHLISQLLTALSSGNPDPPQTPTLPLPAIESLFPSGINRKVMPFMMRQGWGEMRYRINTRKQSKPVIIKDARCGVLPWVLSEDLTGKLIKESRKQRATLTSTLAMALMKTVWKHLYQSRPVPFRHFNFADLRPFLHPPMDNKLLGACLSMMRFQVEMSPEISFWNQVRLLDQETKKSFGRGEKFLFNLTSDKVIGMMSKQKIHRMGTTALSYMGPITFKNHKELMDFNIFVSNVGMGPEYSALARLFRHKIYMDLTFMESDMDKAKAKIIAEDIQNQLAEVSSGD